LFSTSLSLNFSGLVDYLLTKRIFLSANPPSSNHPLPINCHKRISYLPYIARAWPSIYLLQSIIYSKRDIRGGDNIISSFHLLFSINQPTVGYDVAVTDRLVPCVVSKDRASISGVAFSAYNLTSPRPLIKATAYKGEMVSGDLNYI